MYGSIVLKLLIGMVGVLLFLRMTGKTQMAKLTPIDTVNIIVLGALVGSIIYMPDTQIWVLAFAIATWFGLNLLIRMLMKINYFNRLIHGKPEYLIKDGKIDLRILKSNHLGIDQFRAKLRERAIFSLLDVDEAVFETDGKFTIIKKNDGLQSYLLVDNGEIVKEELAASGHDVPWLTEHLKAAGYPRLKDIFCAEYTPRRGFYLIDREGRILSRKTGGKAEQGSARTEAG